MVNFRRWTKSRYVIFGLIVFFFSPLTCWIQTRLLDVVISLVRHEAHVLNTTIHSISVPENNSQHIFPLTLTGDYILNNPDICSGVPRVTALVMVHSAPNHFARRENIRTTYGSRDLFNNQVRVVFLLGLVDDAELQTNIEKEHKKYQDTVQGNFLDSYHNLTHKGVMGFRWITEHCSNVSYVIKVDDDAVFDMWRFLSFYGETNHSNSILCRAVKKGRIFRAGRWKVEEEFFNGTYAWPWIYCPGFVVILTGDVIERLLLAAHTTPFLWIDDVYLFGYLPFQAGNINIYNMPKTLQLDAYGKGVKCLIQKGDKCQYLAVGANEQKFMTYWDLIKKRNKK